MTDPRMEILQRLQAGEISTEEAARLLSLSPATEAPAEGEVITVTPSAAPQPGASWRRFWVYPLMAGGSALILGGLVVGLVYSAGAGWGWLVCGWPLVVLGLLVAALALWSRWAKWLHVRVHEKGRRKVAISFPLPLTLAAWAIRIIGPFVPQLKKTGADDLIIALRDSRRGEPLHVQVDEGEDGDQVEVFIG